MEGWSKIRIVLLLFFIALINDTALAQIRFASGIQSEVYNQFATDISNNTRVPIKVIVSKGSLENLLLIQSDSVQMALIQYDVLYDEGITNPKIKENIKVFLPLYDEEIHLISLKRNGIKNIEDIIGKRVGMGNENSGTIFTSRSIKSKSGIDWIEYIVDFEHSIPALFKDSIDAFFFVGAAPSNLITALPLEVQNQLQLVSIDLGKNNHCFENQIIPRNTYSWQDTDVKTYSIKSLIILNTMNLNGSRLNQIDSLYMDLSDNLRGIQLNKFSHPKWKSVEFSDMENIDWPVFKESFTVKEWVLDSIGWLAALLSLFQVYFIVNKLWKRKHEVLVTESISISAMFISILINSFFAIKNISISGYAQFSNNLLWIMASSVNVLIGIGLFVNANKKVNFATLLGKALNLERKEAGDLAKAFFQPSAADKIIDILSRLALIDNDLDAKEKAYIQHFADEWHIEIDWEIILTQKKSENNSFNALRHAVQNYVSVFPPVDQATHLIDVIRLLIRADGVVSKEELLMEAELVGIISKYVSNSAEIEQFRIAVVPQNEAQDRAIQSKFPELDKLEIAGGTAYLSESYFSEQYATQLAGEYRALNVFSLVFNPRVLAESGHLMNEIKAQMKG